MKLLQKNIYGFLIPAALLVALDEWIKWKALHTFPEEETITPPHFFDLAIHKNWGLAFDIPFRHELIILISFVIGFFLVKMAVSHLYNRPKIAFASLLIILGALGNIFDRLVYGFTVDYMIFFGRSALNISDLFILLGVVLLLIASRKSKVSEIPHVI